MRALTAAEAYVLRCMASPGGAGLTFDPGDPLDEVHEALVLRGCASATPDADDDGTWYDITDLGLLALKVSLPGASVPL